MKGIDLALTLYSNLSKEMTLKIQTLILRVVSCLVLSLALPISATNFAVDGCFECGTESYSHGFEVNYNINGSPANGYLYLGQVGNDNTGHQFMYFMMAEAYVDTVYGAPADDPSSGWNNTSGKGGNGHSFKDIIESDKLGSDKGGYLTFTTPNANAELSIDLLACTGACVTSGKGKDKQYSNSENYASDGWAGNGSRKGDGELKSGSANFIASVQTSMDHNVGLNNFTTEYSLTGSKAGELVNGEQWESHVGYEFEFTSNIFGNLDALTSANLITMLDLGDSHASPAKGDAPPPTIGTQCRGDDNTPDTCGSSTTSVPEPSSMAIFALGIAGLFASKRKKI